MKPMYMIEAERLAINIVKKAIRDSGNKVSDYERKEIHKAARDVLTWKVDGKKIIAQAKRNIKRK